MFLTLLNPSEGLGFSPGALSKIQHVCPTKNVNLSHFIFRLTTFMRKMKIKWHTDQLVTNSFPILLTKSVFGYNFRILFFLYMGFAQENNKPFTLFLPKSNDDILIKLKKFISWRFWVLFWKNWGKKSFLRIMSSISF